MSKPSEWRQPKVIVPSVIAVVAVLALIVVLVSGGGSKTTTDSASATTRPGGGGSDASTVTTVATGDGAGEQGGTTVTTIPNSPYTTPTMPVAVDTTDTAGVTADQAVAIHATPDQGSKLYGVEARLCRGDAAIVSDGDFVPTLGGLCINKPLTSGSDALVAVTGQEPYAAIDLSFRVGVGSTTFMTQYDGSTTITCGPTSPCQIVLKLQYPNGFGFKGVPVTYR